MKILILYIYSINPAYEKMLELQREHILNNSNLDISHYFIQFRNEQSNLVEIENDFIYLKGQESLLKITEKTLNSLKYLLDDLKLTFDFIVRTNISTIINYNNLLNYLNNLPKNNIYCGGKVLKLKNLDYSSGIKSYNHFGLLYASGTSIILSYDVALTLIQNISNINHSIVDDVTIAIFIRKNIPDAYKNLNLYKTPLFLYMNDKVNFSKINNYIFIRNKTITKNCNNKNNISYRENDLINIKNIIEIIKNNI